MYENISSAEPTFSKMATSETVVDVVVDKVKILTLLWEGYFDKKIILKPIRSDFTNLRIGIKCIFRVCLLG